MRRIAALGVVALIALVFGVAQLVLPGIATDSLRDRLARSGQVLEVQVHAFPAIKLLWHRADRVVIKLGRYRSAAGPLGNNLGQTADVGSLDASAREVDSGLLTLRNAGFLTSKRGVGGGYVLRAEPSQITVGEIIGLMDGPLAPVPCAASRPTETCTCPDPRTCALRLLMIDVREELCAMLDHRTIEDVIRASPDPNALAFEI